MQENTYNSKQNSAQDGIPHKRRAHYSGKYPKKFEEKYKELQPEKYADTVEHVKSKGITPAGMHISICVDEILEILDIKPGENGADCTLGYGGHTEAMLKALSGRGHLTSLDVDPIESAKTEERLRKAGYGEDVFAVKLINFAEIDKVAEEYGKFDFLLADLGVSSMQIDNPERGFSYKLEGPLDLRMDPTKGISAAERIKDMSKDELEGMLLENADEPYAEEIAAAVYKARRQGHSPKTTTELRNIIEAALDFLPASEKKESVKKSCQRTFQALRIDVNHEFEVLEQLIEKLPDVLNPGGRAAILTFHSGEDRIVKQLFKEHYKEGLYAEIARDVIRPSKEECVRNSRAKSAKLRYAVRA